MREGEEEQETGNRAGEEATKGRKGEDRGQIKQRWVEGTDVMYNGSDKDYDFGDTAGESDK